MKKRTARIWQESDIEWQRAVYWMAPAHVRWRTPGQHARKGRIDPMRARNIPHKLMSPACLVGLIVTLAGCGSPTAPISHLSRARLGPPPHQYTAANHWVRQHIPADAARFFHIVTEIPVAPHTLVTLYEEQPTRSFTLHLGHHMTQVHRDEMIGITVSLQAPQTMGAIYLQQASARSPRWHQVVPGPTSGA